VIPKVQDILQELISKLPDARDDINDIIDPHIELLISNIEDAQGSLDFQNKM
jgi:hypothetical protein